MRLRITQHGVSCSECNHQGFNLSISTGNSNIYISYTQLGNMNNRVVMRLVARDVTNEVVSILPWRSG